MGCKMCYIRLKDIAERAEVSINTVSRALKDRNDISEPTKQRIRKIADELGYIPDFSASHLRTRSKKTVGVIVTHLDNAFYAKILQGINDAISNAGYTILTLSSNEDLNQEKEILRSLGAHRVSGILIVPSRDLENDLNYDLLHVPHITIVRKGNLNTQSYFVTDSYMSGRLAADYMLSNNRKVPAYIGYNLSVSCNKDRLTGYAERLSEAGIKLPKNRIVHCDSTMQSAYNAASSLVQKNSKIDSLFIYNDHMAFGVLRALYDLNIRVPDQIQIVGHDDVEEAAMSVPALSTIRVPKYSLGYESSSSLIDLIEKRATFTKTVTYTPELIIRET